jgi:hypothetical protein
MTKFITIKNLRLFDFNAIPEVAGVYVVVCIKNKMPIFRDYGTAPKIWHGREVNVSVDELKSKWVNFKQGEKKILYIGKAGGVGQRATLRSRIRSYVRFGGGNKSSHYGGRYIWQISDSDDLEIYWKQDEDPRGAEIKMLNSFKENHENKLPFANLKM